MIRAAFVVAAVISGVLVCRMNGCGNSSKQVVNRPMPSLGATALSYDCKSMGAIRCADQFSGPDCGAKINAADADFPEPKGFILVSRACGMEIKTSIDPQHSIWFTEGGIWNISATINIKHGGLSIIGSGMNDSITNPGTQLQWIGQPGKDLISIAGTETDRIDRVVLQDMILDGGGKARYTVRAEKIDTAEMDRVKIRQGAVAGFYLVDSTGWKLYNSEFTQCPSYCLVSDWGTGGFAWVGGNVDILVANSHPAILVLGATNAWHMQNVELDASGTGAFAGFVQITGFDTNSPFQGAPIGGGGAPAMVNISDSSFFQHSTATAPLQGADVVISGTTSHPSQKIILERDAFFGLNISPAAVKVDFTDNPALRDVISNGHITSTLVMTANASHVLEEFVLSGTDRARCSGAACGNQADIQQGDSGKLTFSGPIELLSFLKIGPNGVPVSAHAHNRVTTGRIPPRARKEVFVIWGHSMGDVNYTVNCTVEDPVSPAGVQGLTYERIRSKLATQIGAIIYNPTDGSVTGTLDCIGDHDKL